MKYLSRSFTVPASHNTSQKQWDRAFMSNDEFEKKYGEKREAEDVKG